MALGLIASLTLSGCNLIEMILGKTSFTLSLESEKAQAASDEPFELWAMISPDPSPEDGYTFEWFVDDQLMDGIPKGDARVWYRGLAATDRNVTIRLKATDALGRSKEAERIITIFSGGSLRIYNSWAPTFSLKFYGQTHTVAGPEVLSASTPLPINKEVIIFGVTPNAERHLELSVYDPYDAIPGTPKTIYTWYSDHFDQLYLNIMYTPGVPKFAIVGTNPQRYNDIVRVGSDTSRDSMGPMPTKPLAFKYQF